MSSDIESAHKIPARADNRSNQITCIRYSFMLQPPTGRPPRSLRQRSWFGTAVLVAWIGYSLAGLAWWAYTEPGAAICVAGAGPQAKER